MKLAIFLLFCLITANVRAEKLNHFVTKYDQLQEKKYAEWITARGISGNEYGVYHFRKNLVLDQKTDQFIVHISADNRYKFYVNGELVCWGPAVGDVQHWNYETVDIASWLKKGENTLAALVWNMGEFKGVRQYSVRTAFILQGDSKTEQLANTDSTWKVFQNKAYSPVKYIKNPVTSVVDEIGGGGYIAGSTDILDGNLYPWGWKKTDFDDANWVNSVELGKGIHFALNTWYITTEWKLQPRSIPLMEEKKEPLGEILKIDGLGENASQFKALKKIKIPENSKVKILIDHQVLSMGYPHLITSGGKDSKIKVRFQESLFESNGQKGRRDQWKNKEMKGYYDLFISDGGINRVFEPLWLRVFRYIEIEIETQQEPLLIEDAWNLFTAYPFEQKASFESNHKSFDAIWEASWRTARLCALESYMDCPYYEQLQYIGDTRIQALISFYMANDHRLARNALLQFSSSMLPMGLLRSCYPGGGENTIPPFSLVYIAMVHDYFMHFQDHQLMKQLIPGMKFILEWFLNRIDSTSQLGPLTHWNHIDGGAQEFIFGAPPGIDEGHSAHMGLLLAYALDLAAEILNDYDFNCDAENYQQISKKIKDAVLENCFDQERGLMAETPNKKMFSQHTNSFAILTGILDQQTEKKVARKLVDDSSLVQTTLYFDYYLFQALKKAGMGGEIIPLMSKWKKFLDHGFTTFPEHGINSRSDCHSWSAHPIYDFLSITCGIEPGSPGFKTLRIQPQMGDLERIHGKMPHHQGEIEIWGKKMDQKIQFEVSVPQGLQGEFIYQDEILKLKPGKNQFEF